MALWPELKVKTIQTGILTVEFSGVYHYTTFERHLFMNILNASQKLFFILSRTGTQFIRSRQYPKLNSSQKKTLWENEGSFQWYDGQGHENWYTTVEINVKYHHTMFEKNRLTNIKSYANIIAFVCLLLVLQSHLNKVISPLLDINYCAKWSEKEVPQTSTFQKADCISSAVFENCMRYSAQMSLAFLHPCDLDW